MSVIERQPKNSGRFAGNYLQASSMSILLLPGIRRRHRYRPLSAHDVEGTDIGLVTVQSLGTMTGAAPDGRLLGTSSIQTTHQRTPGPHTRIFQG